MAEPLAYEVDPVHQSHPPAMRRATGVQGIQAGLSATATHEDDGHDDSQDQEPGPIGGRLAVLVRDRRQCGGRLRGRIFWRQVAADNRFLSLIGLVSGFRR